MRSMIVGSTIDRMVDRMSPILKASWIDHDVAVGLLRADLAGRRSIVQSIGQGETPSKSATKSGCR